MNFELYVGFDDELKTRKLLKAQRKLLNLLREKWTVIDIEADKLTWPLKNGGYSTPQWGWTLKFSGEEANLKLLREVLHESSVFCQWSLHDETGRNRVSE